jgi:hypothetical protein
VKVVINACYGGFSLSAKAERRYLELEGKESYFFTDKYGDDGVREEYIPIDIDNEKDMENIGLWHTCYTIPNPEEVLGVAPHTNRDEFMVDGEIDRESYDKACNEYNDKYREVCFGSRELERNDPLLIQVVEELGEESGGRCAELRIVEIPDDVKWHVEEYDGYEHIAEDHRTWG